jgi:hypothetical protein
MPDTPSTPDPQPATPSGDIRNAPGDTGDPQVPHTRGEREDQAAAERAEDTGSVKTEATPAKPR